MVQGQLLCSYTPSFYVALFGKEKPVFGFAVGFPSKESADKLTYRANKRKIQEIEASREEPEVDEEFYNND